VTRLGHVLQDLRRDLARLDTPWALVGGMAVSVRTEPRFTRDVDVVIAASGDAAAEELVFALGRLGYTIVASVEHVTSGRLATARLLPPDEPESGILVDLIFASSGVEPEIVAAAETVEIFPDVAVPVCATAHLLVLKTLARDDDARPQDQIDIKALAREMDAAAWAEATQLATTIQKRGYDRERDLVAALREIRDGR